MSRWEKLPNASQRVERDPELRVTLPSGHRVPRNVWEIHKANTTVELPDVGDITTKENE